MLNVVLTKFGIPLVIAAAGVVGGIGLQQKVFNPKPVACPACPSCHCPEPTVSVQPFDVEKLKNIKTFTYAPDFKGSVSVAGVDSTSIRKYIEAAVNRAFEAQAQMAKPEKKKRK